MVFFRLTNRQRVVEAEELRLRLEGFPALGIDDGGDEADEFGRVVHAAALTGGDRRVGAARLDLSGDVGREESRRSAEDGVVESGDRRARPVQTAVSGLLVGARVTRFHRQRSDRIVEVGDSDDEVGDGIVFDDSLARALVGRRDREDFVFNDVGEVIRHENVLEVVLERDVLEIGDNVHVGSDAHFGERGFVEHDVDTGVGADEVDDDVKRGRLIEGEGDLHIELAEDLHIGFGAA